ncbi:hypothetical protein ABW21_db0201176 [Orbilia brochopaga]|nr:hypothetical protein ABW21_db0201176 [Drechslerella brochopaga]
MSKVQFKPSYDGANSQKRQYRSREAWDGHKGFILNLLQQKAHQQDIVRALQIERGFETNPGGIEVQTPPPDDPGLQGSQVIDVSRAERRTERTYPKSYQAILPLPDIAARDIDIITYNPHMGGQLINNARVSSSATPTQCESATQCEIPPTRPSENSTSSVNFEEIYEKVLQRLDSFDLAANASTAETPPALNETRSCPGPNTDEYADDLKAWIEEAYDFAEAFINCIDMMMRLGGDTFTFSLCRDYTVEAWIRQEDTDPLPHHVCTAILEGVPVQPVVSGWEDLPYYVLAGPDPVEVDTHLVQRNVWMPVEKDRLLTDDEWRRIDELHDAYYKPMRRFCNRVARYDREMALVTEFCQKAAHLQYLRHHLGEFNYFTVAALGAFAEVSEQIELTDDDAIFLNECAVKAFTCIGLTYHESALDLHTNLGRLLKSKGDFAGALNCFQTAYLAAEYRWGVESTECITRIPEIAELDFKIGYYNAGNNALKKVFVDIKNAVAKLPDNSPDEHFSIGWSLQLISRVLSRTGRKAATPVIAKFALQQYQKYREQYTGDDIARRGWAPLRVAQTYFILRDYDSAIRAYQAAFDEFATAYGVKDIRTTDAIRDMCRAMRRRGLVLYTVPILEKVRRIRAGTPGEDSDDDGVWSQKLKEWRRQQKGREELSVSDRITEL